MLYCRSSTSCRSRMSSVAEPRSLASRQAAVMRSSTKSSATCKNICGLVSYCTVDQTQRSLQRIAWVVCVQQGSVRRGSGMHVAVTRKMIQRESTHFFYFRRQLLISTRPTDLSNQFL